MEPYNAIFTVCFSEKNRTLGCVQQFPEACRTLTLEGGEGVFVFLVP